MVAPVPFPTRPKIVEYITARRFLHIEDSLNLHKPKIRLFAGDYVRGQKMQASAFHFLDVADARVWFSDLAWGKSCDFIDRKGSPSTGDTEELISRIAKLNTANDGKVYFELRNGAGQKIGAGAVKPKGEPEVEINVGMTVLEGRRIGFAVLGYIQAWETAKMIRGTWRAG